MSTKTEHFISDVVVVVYCVFFSFHFFYSVYNETMHIHKCYLFKTQKYVYIRCYLFRYRCKTNNKRKTHVAR